MEISRSSWVPFEFTDIYIFLFTEIYYLPLKWPFTNYTLYLLMNNIAEVKFVMLELIFFLFHITLH